MEVELNVEELKEETINEIEDVEFLKLLAEIIELIMEMSDEQADFILEYLADEEPTIETVKEAIAYAKVHKEIKSHLV